MRYVLWLLKFALFVLILSFAVKNTDIVSVRYYLGQEWQMPLFLVLFLAVCLGVVVGSFALFGRLFSQRRQISTLRNELRLREEPGAKRPPDNLPPIT